MTEPHPAPIFEEDEDHLGAYLARLLAEAREAELEARRLAARAQEASQRLSRLRRR